MSGALSATLSATLGCGLMGCIFVGCQGAAAARGECPVSAKASAPVAESLAKQTADPANNVYSDSTSDSASDLASDLASDQAKNSLIRAPAEPGSALPHVDEAEANAAYALFFAAEHRIAAQVTAQALTLAHTVIAFDAQVSADDEGPELSWYPALGQVAAHERIVVYGTPQVDHAAYRTGEEQSPFRVIITVPCRIWSRSGEGIPVLGEPPAADQHSNDSHGPQHALPVSTTWRSVKLLSPTQQQAALAARESCAAAAGREETVAVPLTFVLERESGTVVLDVDASAPQSDP